MNDVATAKRHSRFSTAPKLNKKGHPKGRPPYALNNTEVAILRCLASDRFLSTPYLAALIGTSSAWIIDCLQILKSKPYPYVQICEEQADPIKRRFHIYTPLQYELADLGIQTVRERLEIALPARRRAKFIAHQIMADQVIASLRIGLNASNGRFDIINRDQLLAHKNMPESTRKRQFPDYIPLPDIQGVKKGEHAIRPDREMFVIRDKERGIGFFFPGIEIGTGSETHKPGDGRHDHSYTESKFADYITILQHKIYRSYFGHTNEHFYIPFIEPTAQRLANMMALLEDMTKHVPKVRQHFLFKTHPLFTDMEKPRATGHALTEDWQRVGVEPFNFATA